MASSADRVARALLARKESKAEADYGPGMQEAHCGICRHFIQPNACEIVEGEIAPDMWCRHFSR